MIKIALCDDEKQILSTLQKMLEAQYEGRLSVITGNNPWDMLNEWEQSPDRAADILITDIQFQKEADKKNGIDFAKKMQEKFPRIQIIFISGYLEYVTEIFDVYPVCFLLKPVEKERLYKAVDRCIKSIEETEEKSIYLEEKGKVEKLYINEIVYVESKGRKLIIHMKGQDKIIHMKIGTLEEKLPFQFLRSHQSYLVNMDYISGFAREELTLADGIKLPISRMRYSMAKEKMMMYLLNHQE